MSVKVRDTLSEVFLNYRSPVLNIMRDPRWGRNQVRITFCCNYGLRDKPLCHSQDCFHHMQCIYMYVTFCAHCIGEIAVKMP